MQYTCEHTVGEKFYKFVNSRIEQYEISSCEFGYASNWYTLRRCYEHSSEKRMATDDTLKTQYLTHRELLNTLVGYWAALENGEVPPDTLKSINDLLVWDEL